eukprot:jgi/Mesen1/10259/ME000778S09597
MAAEPSKVIHIRNVGQEVTEADLNQLAMQFGAVQKIVMIRSKNQALLQLVDLPIAINMMNYYSGVQPNIRGRNVYMQFSSHQELTSTDQPSSRRGDQEQQPNRILLVTIHNPLYPINVDVLHQVFSPHGFVEKIVIFQKFAGLQALLQYANQQSAAQACSTLQGRNIYDGCCTLDIQFSNLDELQVNFNNDRTRDYTNSELPEQGKRGGALGGSNQASLFGEGGAGMYGMAQQGPRPGFQQQPGGPPHNMAYHTQMMNINNAAAAFGGVLPPGITGTNDRANLLISNLDPENMDPDKLFNLFSNYGNVVRIKMLHNKPDHALVQLGDGLQAELAVYYLKGVTLFGKRLEVNYSKHPQINPSPDTKDFTTSPLNRFNRNAVKNYRHCCAPTRMVHCSSLPTDVTTESISAFLGPHGTIVGAKIFEKDGKKQALVQYSSVEEATEVLVTKHAQTFQGSVVRLAFSKNQTL